jgi:carotenoid cleavage dioxygenase-like enzyme
MFSSYWLLFVVLLLLKPNNGLLQNKWGLPFKTIDHEINKRIKYNLNSVDKETVSKINGFYGIIGPDINITTVNTLYDLFTGNGNIQGVFFNKGELTYVKHYVKTERLQLEENNGKIPGHIFTDAIFGILHKMGKMPNILGVANTALINIKNKIYALYEQDHPYLLDIDFTNKKITTIGKTKIPNIEHFSAHSKYDSINNIVHTIDYDVLNNSVSYYSMDDKFNILSKNVIKTNYVPIIHDFIVLDNGILITESPIIFDIKRLFSLKVPVRFDKKLPTKIHIIDKVTNNLKTYTIDEGFYIFHYADFKETENHIVLYAAIYENLDFTELDIKGCYRKIIIHKETGRIEIVKNPELEKFNLDFPIKSDNSIIIRNLNKNKIDGFIICDKLVMKDRIALNNRSICGEPVITEIDKIPHLITFAYNKQDSFIIIINLKTHYKIEIPIPHHVNIGFHSIFIKNIT